MCFNRFYCFIGKNYIYNFTDIAIVYDPTIGNVYKNINRKNKNKFENVTNRLLNCY